MNGQFELGSPKFSLKLDKEDYNRILDAEITLVLG